MGAHKGWIGVDLDGTLAYYEGWIAADHIGEPIAPMVERVKAWRAEGREVRIFTARVFPITEVLRDNGQLEMLRFTMGDDRLGTAVTAAVAIADWCRKTFGFTLPITCVKDFAMIELYDDRAVQVEPNTGRLIGASTRGL